MEKKLKITIFFDSSYQSIDQDLVRDLIGGFQDIVYKCKRKGGECRCDDTDFDFTVVAAATPKLMADLTPSDDGAWHGDNQNDLDILSAVFDAMDYYPVVLTKLFLINVDETRARVRPKAFTLEGRGTLAGDLANGGELAHEFGHFVGLKHVYDSIWNLMYPIAGSRPDCDYCNAIKDYVQVQNGVK